MATSNPEPIMCPKCNVEHDTTKCKAHSRRQGGGQCQRAPMDGLEVCSTHGGRASQVKAAAELNKTEQRMRRTIGKLKVEPVENPLLELQLLAGEARAWKEAIAERVANLERLRYSTDGGEAIQGEVILFERALDRCVMVLTAIAKLNIDERLVRIAQTQQDAVIAAIDAALTAVGLTGSAVAEARLTVARHLKAVA